MSAKSRQEDERVLSFIREYLYEQQQQASTKQIAAGCGMTLQEAARSVARLQNMGRLQKNSTVPTNYPVPQ